MAGLELIEQAQDASPTFRGVIELHVERRDALDPEPVAELALDEPRRPLERDHRRPPLVLGSDHADPDPGVPEVRRRLDVGDGREPDPRIRDLPFQDRADLLAQELVDAVRPLAHRGPQGVVEQGRAVSPPRPGCASAE
jgi:hypothetical protein